MQTTNFKILYVTWLEQLNLMSFSSLIMIYYSLFHSVLAYGILFWGISSNSDKLFKLQKRVVRIMTGHGNRTSCKDLFKKLEILPLRSLYIFSILLFVIKNKKHFITNYDSHNIETRKCANLHFPNTWLTLYQNGVYFTGIKICNKLPSYLKDLVGFSKILKRSLKIFNFPLLL
jgi:hypothetical protein